MNEITDAWMIKTNCAHCAHKHLTAAYTLLTSNAGREMQLNEDVPLELLFVARARIAYAEAYNGYRGNADLAMGCLAAAETLARSSDTMRYYRDIRLRIGAGLANKEEILKEFNAMCTSDTLALAHLAEAKRELPELNLPSLVLARASEGELCAQLPCSRAGFLIVLVTLIHDVAELYELHNKEVKS